MLPYSAERRPKRLHIQGSLSYSGIGRAILKATPLAAIRIGFSRSLCASVLTCIALSGCGLYDTREARDPLHRSAIIGMYLPDLLASLGKPDKVQRSGPHTAVIEYDWTDASTGLKATLTLVGSVELGGGGRCSVVFEIQDDGLVTGVAFPRSHSDQLFSPPYSACAPLVSEVLNHPNDSAGPDPEAFERLGIGKG